MAVAYHSTKSLTAATGTGVASSAWDLTGLSNPVILVHIAMNRNGGALPSVSSLTWSLGGGSASKVIGVSTAFTTIETWVIPAPTAGSGTFTPTLSTSVAYQITADAFTGADQTTPCPTGDAVSTTGAGPAHTLTPTNVVAGDGQAGCGAQTVNDNPVSYAPSQTYLSGSTSINAMAGYRIGTGNLVTTWDGTNTGEKASTGVRIVQAAGGGGRTTKNTRSAPLGTDIGMGWRMASRARIFVPAGRVA